LPGLKDVDTVKNTDDHTVSKSDTSDSIRIFVTSQVQQGRLFMSTKLQGAKAAVRQALLISSARPAQSRWQAIFLGNRAV
jgi:hypothetical protein